MNFDSNNTDVLNMSGIRDFLIDQFKIKASGKVFSLQDVQKYIDREFIPETYGGGIIIKKVGNKYFSWYKLVLPNNYSERQKQYLKFIEDNNMPIETKRRLDVFDCISCKYFPCKYHKSEIGSLNNMARYKTCEDHSRYD